MLFARNSLPFPLARISQDYLKEEIERVIKGTGCRALRTIFPSNVLDAGDLSLKTCASWYGNCMNSGQEKLSERNAVPFADKRIRARDAVQRLSQAPYRCVVVDEAQDVTLVELQLVRALVAGNPKNPVPRDGILILDDPAQRIYAGGYRLGWPGLILLAGRKFSKGITEICQQSIAPPSE